MDMMVKRESKEAWLKQADTLLDAGRLPEAGDLYRRIVEIDPLDAESWLMLAAIEAESGKPEAALACCDRVLVIDPQNAEAFSIKGRLQQALGDCASARETLSQATRLDPDDGDAWNALAGTMLKLGMFGEAEQCGREAVRLLPDNADAHVNLGNALAGLGAFVEARRFCAQAAQLDERNGLAWGGLALACEQMGDWLEARQAYTKMLACLQEHPVALVGLARVCLAQEQWAEAGRILERALKVDQEASAELLRNLAHLNLHQGNADTAEQYLLRASQLEPANASVLVDLGNYWQNQKRFIDAEACYVRALDVAGRYPEAHFNLGVCKQRQGQYDAARVCFDRAINCRPDFVEAHWYQSFVCLIEGDYARGWDEYEWRLRQKQNIPRPFDKPVWDGSNLVGRTILIHDEQGLGDTFQFVRYLPFVKAKGGRVAFECHAGLRPILAGCDGYDEIHERVSPGLLPGTAFDTHIHLLSLPRIFGTRLETVPTEVPYIKANPERVGYWKKRVADDPAFKVGIVWAGSPKHTNEMNRSCALADFRAVADLQSVSLYSLQKGSGSEQTNTLHGMAIRSFGEELDQAGRFVDTAALIANLDLVITIDTAIAHLAGAMGRPVWVLLCASPDWRWGLVGHESPWYPTMRLFRQTENGNWKETMVQVALELERLLSGGRGQACQS